MPNVVISTCKELCIKYQANESSQPITTKQNKTANQSK